MTAFLFCLAVIGITDLLVEGAIFSAARDWLGKKLEPELYYLTTCHQCVGTWVGFFCGLALNSGFWGTTLTLSLAALGGALGWWFLKKYHPHLVLVTAGAGFFLGSWLVTENAWLIILSGGAGAFLAPLGEKVLKYLTFKVESMEVYDVRPGNETVGDGTTGEKPVA